MQELTNEEALSRLKQYGPNTLPEAKVSGLSSVFFRQFISPLIFILIFSAIIIFLMGETWDSLLILVVLLFNAVIGTFQEGKAQNALQSLKKFAEGSATVVRQGKTLIIPDKEVVPGDIILLQEGEKVPADARLFASHSLQADESMLTGESVPVAKDFKDPKLSMLFRGTTIVSGNGRAEVTATGLSTEIGKISSKIISIDTDVPLKKNIENLSRILILVVFVIALLVFFLGILRGEPMVEMFATVVALSVSIVPEGLPVVLTLVLASGVWKMAKRNVLVKRLQAVEALGQAKIIAVDKTGTITENEMVLQKVYVDGKTYEIGGVGYSPTGEFFLDGKKVDPLNHPDLMLSARVAAFSSDAHAIYIEESKTWKVSGDPTEAAMVVFAEKVGFKDIDEESEKIFEIPFNHDNKYHLTIRRFENKNFLSIIGAPESILRICDRVWKKQKSEKFSIVEREDAEKHFLEFSRKGYRVLALAARPDAGEDIDSGKFSDMIFVGFFAIRDPLRPHVREEVLAAKEAGIRTIMITGDHEATAHAIAVEAGIAGQYERIITGEQIDMLSDEQLTDKFDSVDVFARVTPDHKLRIIELFRKRGEIVAMTGDGVNDAPSLAAADLGVAMGIKGTEVAKDAADIVLLDDNFGSIIAAVEEGRSIYKTIKKVILYLFSTSIGEALAIMGAIFIGLPLPVLPAQIIWLNFVTDGFLVLALAVEPKEKGLLDKNFRQSRSMIDVSSFMRMSFMGFIIAAGTLIIFWVNLGGDMARALTISLNTLAIFQWFNAWNCKSEKGSVFSRDFFKNQYLILATFTVIVLQLLAVYHPFFQRFLHTVSIGVTEWIYIIAVSLSVLLFEEVRKLVSRHI